MLKKTFQKKMDSFRKAATKSGIVATSPVAGAIKQGKFIGGAIKKGVKKYGEGLDKMDRARKNRDWQYQMGNPNASDFDLSGPPNKKK